MKMYVGRLGTHKVAQRLWRAALLAAFLYPSSALAGQIYGSVIMAGQGLPNATIEITCGGATTPGATAADGSYRIDVPQEGQCTLTLPGLAGTPTAVIFSNPNPAGYSFEVVRNPDGTHVLRSI